MSGLKTKENDASVHAFLAGVEDVTQHADCRQLVTIMQSITGEPPKMWGTSIVGFGRYHYRYASGREGDWFLTGFSPRKKVLSIYLLPGFKTFDLQLKKLGKFKTGSGCLYVKSLADIEHSVLNELVELSVEAMRKQDVG